MRQTLPDDSHLQNQVREVCITITGRKSGTSHPLHEHSALQPERGMKL